MKLLLFILFALAPGSGSAIPSLKDCQFITVVAGAIFTGLGTFSGLYVWYPHQHNTDIAPFDSAIFRNDTTSVDLWQPRLSQADENDTAPASKETEQSAQVNYTIAATSSTYWLCSLHPNATNAHILVSTPIPEELPPSDPPLTSNEVGLPTTLLSIPARTFVFGLDPAIFFRSCLALIVLLVTYQLLVYGSSFHDCLYSRIQYLLARITWFAMVAVDKLPPHAVPVVSAILLLSIELFSRICECFHKRNDAVISNLVAIRRELRKLSSPRYRQAQEGKRLRTFRRMRYHKAQLAYRRAAQEFKDQHDHWHAIFQNGITDIGQQLANYTLLETRVKAKSTAAAKEVDLLSSRIKNLSDLEKKLDKVMQLVIAALPKSKQGLEDMQALIRQINKLLRESSSAETKVRQAEDIIRTLYDVESRMHRAPFTDKLKSIAKEAAETQKVIYEAESSIVLATHAYRSPRQLLESLITHAEMPPCAPPLRTPSCAPRSETTKSVEPLPPQGLLTLSLPCLPPPPSLQAQAAERPPTPVLAPVSVGPSTEPQMVECPPIAPLISLPATPTTPPLAEQRPPTPPLELVSAKPRVTECPQVVPLVSPPALPIVQPQAAWRPSYPVLAPVSVPLPPSPLVAPPPPCPPLSIPPQQPSPPPQMDVVPPSDSAEPNDESMTDAPPVLAPPPPPTPMVDTALFSAPPMRKGEGMAEAPPASVPVHPDAAMGDAVPPPVSAKSKEETMADPPTIPAPAPTPATVAFPAPATAKSSEETMTEAPPVLTPIPAPVAFKSSEETMTEAPPTPTPIPAPVAAKSSEETMTEAPPAPTPISASVTAKSKEETMSEAPTVPAAIPAAAPLRSKRINQAAFDEIMAPVSRPIKKPISRLKKPTGPKTTPGKNPFSDSATPSLPDNVSRLVNDEASDLNDCLLAERDDVDDDGGDRADYNSEDDSEDEARARRYDTYRSFDSESDSDSDPDNGYPHEYGDLSDYDSDS